MIIKVDCIRHNYPQIKPVTITEDNIRLTSIEDIAAMKLAVIAKEGTRVKDFIDVACLSTKMSLSEMIESFQEKYPDVNSTMAIKSLLFHDDIIEGEKIDIIGHKYDWKCVQTRLIEMVNNPNKVFSQLSFEKIEETLQSPEIPKMPHTTKNKGMSMK